MEESSFRTGCIMHLWSDRMYPDIHEQEISKEFPVHTIALRSHNPSEMKQVADMTSGTCSFLSKTRTRSTT
jgi:hypothetical protein